MNISQYKIVIPIDFSETPDSLKNSLSSLTSKISYEIALLHVCSTKKEVYTAEKKMELWKEELPHCTSAEIRIGEVSEEILKFANEVEASLILVKSSGTASSKSDYVSLISKNILSKSIRPVFILKNTLEFKEIKTILLPLGIDLENKLKLQTAIFFSRFFNKAQIRIVSIVFNADSYVINKLAYRMQHLVHFFERSGCDCVGELVRCNDADGETIGKAVTEYADRSEAEIVLLTTSEEDIKNSSSALNEEVLYMLSHLTNNIICLTPQPR